MAALKAPGEGQVFKLKDDWGIDNGALSAGVQATVTGIHPPGTPGLGYSEVDTVTADIEQVDGPPRTIALSVAEFHQRFQKAA